MRTYKQLTPEEQREAREQLMEALLRPEMLKHYPADLRRELEEYTDAHEGLTYDGLFAAQGERIRAALSGQVSAGVKRAHYAGPGDIILRLRSEQQAAGPAQAGLLLAAVA